MNILKGRSALRVVVLIQLLLILLAPLPILYERSHGKLFLISCLCLALGLQNGAYHKLGPLGIHTTVITGNVTGMLSELEKLTSLNTRPTSPTPQLTVVRTMSLLWLWFALGAGAASFSVRAVGAKAVWASHWEPPGPTDNFPNGCAALF